MVNGCAKVKASSHALGSPERGAVAARSGVTEGLVQGGCGETKLFVNRGRAGVEDKPLRRVGKYQRKTHVVGYPTEGASGTPPSTVGARFRFQRSREV